MITYTYLSLSIESPSLREVLLGLQGREICKAIRNLTTMMTGAMVTTYRVAPLFDDNVLDSPRAVIDQCWRDYRFSVRDVCRDDWH